MSVVVVDAYTVVDGGKEDGVAYEKETEREERQQVMLLVVPFNPHSIVGKREKKKRGEADRRQRQLG